MLHVGVCCAAVLVPFGKVLTSWLLCLLCFVTFQNVSWSASELMERLAPWNWFKPSGNIFLLTVLRRFFFCKSFELFISCVCHASASVHCCLVVSYLERDGLLAVVCDVRLCLLLLSHVVSKVRCGTWLYRFLILASFLTLDIARPNRVSWISFAPVLGFMYCWAHVFACLLFVAWCICPRR